MDQLHQGPAASKPMMSLGQAVKQCLRKYASFSGRATRAEFWWWVLVSNLVVVGVTIVDGALSAFLVSLGIPFVSPLGILLAIGIFLPSLAVAVRRLHDIGKSGWWLLVWYVTYLVASLTLLVSLVVVFVLLLLGETGGSEFAESVLESGEVALFILLGLACLALAAMLAVVAWSLVWLVRQGEGFPNRYGEDPRALNVEEMGQV